LLFGVALVSGMFGSMLAAPAGHADVVAYLVNVTVRPGYNFANADAAVAYGQAICDKVAGGRSYPQITGDVKSDFATSDEFQASFSLPRPSTSFARHRSGRCATLRQATVRRGFRSAKEGVR